MRRFDGRWGVAVLAVLAMAAPAAGFAQEERSGKKKVKTSKRLSDQHYREVELAEPAEFVALQAPIEEARRALLDSETRIRTAKLDLEKAKDLVSIEELDHTAAKWELKAAKANQDGRRTRDAEERLAQTKLDLDVAKAMQKWRKERLDATQADVRRDRARIEHHEAERELRAVELLHERGSIHAERYEIATFQSRASSRLTAYEKARRKADDAWTRAGRLERDYARLARKQGRDVVPAGADRDGEPDGNEEPIVEDLSGGG